MRVPIVVVMEVPGNRRNGRPKPRCLDCINRGMRVIGATEDEIYDRTGWKGIQSAAATPN